MQSNTLVEQDITHLNRLMRAIVFRRVGARTGYWRASLDVLAESRHLTGYQRLWVREFTRELDDLEQQKLAAR